MNSARDLDSDSRSAASSAASSSQTEEFWTRYFRVYDTLNDAIPYRDMVQRHVDLIRLEPGAHVLDAGTGTGNVARALAQNGAQVTGVDFCEPALAICREKVEAGDFRFADLTKPLEFKDGSFDYLTCCCVLHLLDAGSQLAAVREFARTVKPGGRIAISTFAVGFRPLTVYAAALSSHLREHGLLDTVQFALRYSLATARILYYVGQIKRHEQKGGHRFLDRESLSDLIIQAGLELESIEPIFASQCWIVLARKPRNWIRTK